MDWFKTISDFYKSSFYTDTQVKVFVEKGKITHEQYEEITGKPYSA
ncbi:hypothetical protein KZO01_06490 [Kurthia zopfii]|uniref:Phage uncharacterized protein, XkdX family n=1 Tax=Kurthia zopfii TaxID=1650 RepID=A0A8B4Q940_9BACL|nr:XkdX family protein [Kurthia zopfii]PWI23483.1 XkdX family protein [Kurthia zopfii]TDR35511.1 putative XkdX family phage protein [Kurthia zopfii]GEK30340.1 hypothetical protein KZO01_06490 [Kurthia zopfii]STX09227.1 phage uncharacterized protein, XkdX family [Kurthia zopfii]